jgi:hypothetical protein
VPIHTTSNLALTIRITDPARLMFDLEQRR